MPFLTQGDTNWKFIGIVAVLAVVVGGGILWCLQEDGFSYQQPKAILDKLSLTTKKLAVITDDCILEPIYCEGDINCIATEIINQGKNCYLYSYTFSSDGNRVAYVLAENPRVEEIFDENVRFIENYKLDFYAIVDGEKSQAYDYIFYLDFSPDSGNFFYTAGRNNKPFLIINEEIISVDGDDNYYGACRPFFDQKSKRFVYCVRTKDGKELIVLDGKRGDLYDNVLNLKFSPDGKYLAYVAKKEGNAFAVLDEKEGRPYNRVASLNFSPDAKKLAYVGYREERAFMVIDDEEKHEFEDIISFTFSPDSKRLAFIVREQQGDFLVLDGKTNKIYKRINNCPIFSPDSNHIVYVAEKENRKKIIIIDDKEGKEYDSANYPYPQFSPDSKHLVYTGVINSKHFVVFDGKEIESYDGNLSLSWFTFSPDGKRLAYILKGPLNYSVVLDNEVGSKYERIPIGEMGYRFLGNLDLVFSPNSHHLAYVATKDNKHFIVLDGKESGPYDEISEKTLKFTDDSKYMQYGARLNNELWCIVEKLE